MGTCSTILQIVDYYDTMEKKLKELERTTLEYQSDNNMPTDLIDEIYQAFSKSLSAEEKNLWKGDIPYQVTSVIYYRCEELINELLECYPDRQDITELLLARIRYIYENFSTMETGNQARIKLITDMMHANMSPIAITRVDLITEACLGYNRGIEEDLNLPYVNLELQQPAIRRLASICLSHFEQKIAEQITAKQLSEHPQTTPLASY